MRALLERHIRSSPGVGDAVVGAGVDTAVGAGVSAANNSHARDAHNEACAIAREQACTLEHGLGDWTFSHTAIGWRWFFTQSGGRRRYWYH